MKKRACVVSTLAIASMVVAVGCSSSTDEQAAAEPNQQTDQADSICNDQSFHNGDYDLKYGVQECFGHIRWIHAGSPCNFSTYAWFATTKFGNGGLHCLGCYTHDKDPRACAFPTTIAGGSYYTGWAQAW